MSEEPPAGLTLADVLAAAAEGLDGVAVVEDKGTVTWFAGPAPFATLSGERVTFRLDPLVARAALRTPETSPSDRGSDWLTFAPAELDDEAIDRVEAWFLSAHRRVRSKRAN